MLDDFIRHNCFWQFPKNLESRDPHLSLLKNLKFVHPLDWWRNISWDKPGIYILTGGRQIGKSTSTKLLIQHVIAKNKMDPKKIFYLPCDQITDCSHLYRVLKFFLESLSSPEKHFLLILDEVTFIQDWQRIIKSLADEAWFRRGFCILTGSDTIVLKQATTHFPGRRGEADQTDFHLLPLSFKEYVQLTIPKLLKNPENKMEALFLSFNNYLKCGGYLRAINDLHTHGEVKEATYLTFEQWIRGDMLKRGKSEQNLLAILHGLVVVGVSQISFSSLTQKIGLVSKETLIDYCHLLERMDVMFDLQAFDQNTLRGFPKKARKFHFSDPFIRHTIERWLTRERYLTQISSESILVESCVAAQFYHRVPVYYLKAEGEIDLILVQEKKFLPVEVKWTSQTRSSDLKQLRKYQNSILLTKNLFKTTHENISAIPLPLFLVGE